MKGYGHCTLRKSSLSCFEHALGLEVSLSMTHMTGREFIEMPRVLTIDKLSISIESMPNQNDFSKCPNLMDVEIPMTD